MFFSRGFGYTLLDFWSTRQYVCTHFFHFYFLFLLVPLYTRACVSIYLLFPALVGAFPPFLSLSFVEDLDHISLYGKSRDHRQCGSYSGQFFWLGRQHETNVTELALQYRRVEPNRQTNELSTCVCVQLSSLSELCVDFLNRADRGQQILTKEKLSSHIHTQELGRWNIQGVDSVLQYISPPGIQNGKKEKEKEKRRSQFSLAAPLLDTLPRYNIHSSLIQCPYLSFSSFPPFFSFFFGGKFQIRSLEFTKLVCEHSPRSFLLRSPWRLGHLVGKRRRIPNSRHKMFVCRVCVFFCFGVQTERQSTFVFWSCLFPQDFARDVCDVAEPRTCCPD